MLDIGYERFHDLSEFDDKKRSCRRRLSDHNARRRRVQPESIQLSSTGLSSALYAGFYLNLIFQLKHKSFFFKKCVS